MGGADHGARITLGQNISRADCNPGRRIAAKRVDEWCQVRGRGSVAAGSSGNRAGGTGTAGKRNGTRTDSEGKGTTGSSSQGCRDKAVATAVQQIRVVRTGKSQSRGSFESGKL